MVWLVDEFACRYLTRARNVVGTPFAFALELHGWYVGVAVIFRRCVFLTNSRWHILTAIGGYNAVVVVDMITSEEPVTDPLRKLAWPVPSATRMIVGRGRPVKKV